MASIVADSEAQANADKNIQKNRYLLRKRFFIAKLQKRGKIYL